LLFELDCLEKLEALIKSTRRIEKSTVKNITDEIEDAKCRLWDAYHLWERLDRSGEVSSSDFGRRTNSQKVLTMWNQMGFVVDKGDSRAYTFETRMDARIRGKCSNCGAVGTGSKEKLLQKIKCPRCSQDVYFVW